ncbi:hypothetical protein SASPL_111182 [Salvia splendens]|uniref:Uncharacterized protein n=1 Tax=Salvia splendens TaxID=180675 RepID=A0A8X9A3D8_SALSN|nr:hypothetical protein SASPL_111182 [Salvia splendens]
MNTQQPLSAPHSVSGDQSSTSVPDATLAEEPHVSVQGRCLYVHQKNRLRGDVGRVEIKELHEEHADADMDSCNAGKESARDCFEDESTGSKPLPANGSRDHICTFKDVLMRGLKERDVNSSVQLYGCQRSPKPSPDTCTHLAKAIFVPGISTFTKVILPPPSFRDTSQGFVLAVEASKSVGKHHSRKR